MSFDPFGQDPQQQGKGAPRPGDSAAGRTTAPGVVLIICSVFNLLLGLCMVGGGYFYSSVTPQQFEEIMSKSNPGQFKQLQDQGWTAQDLLNIYTKGGYGGGGVVLVLALICILGGVCMVNRKAYGLAMLSSVIMAVPCVSPMSCPCLLIGMGIGIWCIVTLLAEDVRASFR